MVTKYNFLSILIIFSIIASLSFIFAEHIVKTSTGGISYNINEDTQYTFNISINNTDSAPIGNITQVNITIPSSFLFANGTSSSSSVFISLFMNTSTILSWTNSTPFLINGTTNNTYFAFNATAQTPGNYNITVMTLNRTGTYFANISVSVNDTTIPSVVIAYPSNATNYSSSSIDFNLTLSDNVNISSCWFTLTSGAANYTMTINSTKTGANYTNSSIADGTYTAKFYCNDTSNNLNGTEQVTFTKDIAPVVTLISPTNGNTAVTTSITFAFNVSDNSATNCSLLLNDNTINFNSSVNRTGATNYFINFSYIPVVNAWKISCRDIYNTNGNSSTWSFSLVSFNFSGTSKNDEGAALNNSVINITIRSQAGWSIVGYAAGTSNVSGQFNLSIASNDSWIYEPSITHSNATFGFIDFRSKIIPAFPSMMMSMLSGTIFYLAPAGTINMTAINSTGQFIPFNYQIKDTSLGYPIASNFDTMVSQAIVYVPKNRNYSIMIYPNQSIPVSFNWNNFSSSSSYNISISISKSYYNATSSTLHKIFNTSLTMAWVSGVFNVSNGTAPIFTGINVSNFTIIPYLLEPGNMVHADYGDLPYNLSFFNQGKADIYNLSTQKYNISLPATIESSTIILFASAVSNDSNYYGAFRNLSLTYGANPTALNFTNITRLFGNVGNITMNRVDGVGVNIPIFVKKQMFTLVNATNRTIGNTSAHAEITVDYSSLGAIEFTWMADVAQSSATSFFEIPLLNSTGIKEMNIFANGGGGGNSQYAPKTTAFTVSQLASATNTNISIRAFNPRDTDNNLAVSQISINLYISNSTCDIPNPTGCILGGSSQTMADFNPMKAVMGGGKISFRMGTGNILVHYVNVDMLASGPPDALFENDAGASESSDAFANAVKFGSGGPSIYDYVLVSIPYSETAGTGLDDSQTVNMSIPKFYDDNWNTIWDTSVNGTNPNAFAGNYSHYSTRQSEWAVLFNQTNCTTGTVTLSSQINSTNPCYIDTTNNKVWIRLPHFDGTGPSISGAIVSSTSTTTSTSGGGGSAAVTYWTSTKTISDDEFAKGASRELGTKERIKISVESASHYVGVVGLTSTTVTINVSSTPQQATLKIGEEKKFEVTGDNYYDVYVKLNSISSNKADITVKKIHEAVSAVSGAQTTGAAGENQTGTPAAGEEEIKEPNLIWLWVVIGILIVIVAVVIVFRVMIKKKKDSGKLRRYNLLLIF